MLQLKSFGPAFGQPSASPFVVKAMCLLNMAGATWENHPGADPRKAPYQKLPALKHEGGVVADSDSIRYFLEDKYGIDFDESLTPAQRGQSRALIRMAEEHLYWCGVRDRWMNDKTFEHLNAIFFSEMPPVIGPLIVKMVRKGIVKDIHSQGIGRLPYDVMLQRAEVDLNAIEQCLGEQRFLFGDKPTAADASVGTVLAAVAANPEKTALSQAVLTRPVLMTYVKNVEEAMYPKP